MIERIVIETRSEAEVNALVTFLQENRYFNKGIVKVCGEGRCSQAGLFVKQM